MHGDEVVVQRTRDITCYDIKTYWRHLFQAQVSTALQGMRCMELEIRTGTFLTRVEPMGGEKVPNYHAKISVCGPNLGRGPLSKASVLLLFYDKKVISVKVSQRSDFCHLAIPPS